LETKQSPVLLDLSEETRVGKSHYYRNAIVLEKLPFQNVFRPHENAKPAFGFKSVFEKLRFPDGLVWTAGQKLRVQISPAKRGRSLKESLLCERTQI